MRGILAQYRDLARGTPPVALQDLHRGGLPGAVGAQEREYLSAPNAQIDAADSLERAVSHPQPRDRDHSLTADTGVSCYLIRADCHSAAPQPRPGQMLT